MTRSKIEWTDRSDWNPIRGCSRISEGCGSARGGGCYAEIMAARFSKPAVGDKPAQWGHGFAHMVGGDYRWTGRVEVQWDRLELPLRWRKPARIFATSTSDLFHERLPLHDIAMVYGTAIAAHHLRGHVLQILTKRSDRMRELLHSEEFWDVANSQAGALIMERVDPLDRRSDDARATYDDYGPENPAPGIWHGVSVEDQPAANRRIPDLIATPSALRWISGEPTIARVNLTAISTIRWRGAERLNALTGRLEGLFGDYCPTRVPALDWVICGGESGPGARPMHPDWARSLRDQCAAAGVPFFFKQWGAWAPLDPDGDGFWPADKGGCIRLLPDGTRGERGWPMQFVGKGAAGHLLDGVEHRGMPA